MNNSYIPHMARIVNVCTEVEGERGIKTFRVKFEDEPDVGAFRHRPGQCAMLNVLGEGEAMFAIASPPGAEFPEFSVMRVGKVTRALHDLRPGDQVAVRGPYGNGFPMEKFRGKDLVLIGAGIGITPVRAVYRDALAPANRDAYGKITIIYGARTPSDLAYKKEMEELEGRDDVELYLCIDWKMGPRGPLPGSASDGWPAIDTVNPSSTAIPPTKRKYTCFVPQLVEAVAPSPNNAIAVTCGPPIAIRFITENLSRLGFSDSRIYTTLEMRMKCGIGKCGRCNIGGLYVCKDGPVFSFEQLKRLKGER